VKHHFRKNLMRILSVTVVHALFLCISFGGEVRVVVSNPLPFDRHNATVEIAREGFRGQLTASIAVFEGEKRLVSQVIDIDEDGVPDVLLFQSSFGGGEQKEFVLRDSEEILNTTSPTDVKYVLPRKDVAWENDRIAFRIYGSELAGDVLNGIDVWTKRVRHHVIDTWYGGDSLKGKERKSYHVDHGEGADFFTVGRTLGCGSTAIWADGIVDQSGLFTNHRIIARGPVRLAFEVRYEKESSTGTPFREVKTISIDAGSNLNRIDVWFPGMIREGAFTVAAGLVKRADIEGYSSSDEGWVSVWGPTNSDTVNGELGTGIIMPMEAFRNVLEDSVHYLVLGTTTTEKRITYYTGACWTRGGDFNSAEEWNAYLSQQAQILRNPLRLEFVK
jgi:pectinesterase